MQKTPIPAIPVFGDTAAWNNPAAMYAYRCSLLAMIPVVGLVLGPVAAVWGLVAMRRYRANRKIKGFGQARVAMMVGATTLVSNVAGLACIAYGQGWF